VKNVLARYNLFGVGHLFVTAKGKKSGPKWISCVSNFRYLRRTTF